MLSVSPRAVCRGFAATLVELTPAHAAVAAPNEFIVLGVLAGAIAKALLLEHEWRLREGLT